MDLIYLLWHIFFYALSILAAPALGPGSRHTGGFSNE